MSATGDEKQFVTKKQEKDHLWASSSSSSESRHPFMFNTNPT
jgi:hypothetical protein